MSAKDHRRLHILVLVMFLYQMNVCPCGHLEHNGWYQLAKSYLTPPAVTSDLEDSLLGFSFRSGGSHDCEESELAYLAVQRGNRDLLRDSVAIGNLTSAEQTQLISSPPVGLAFQSEAPKTLLALEMRAELQVFLL